MVLGTIAMFSRPVLSQLALVAIAVASCSRVATEPSAQTAEATPAPVATPAPPSPKPAPPAKPAFRSELFQNCLRAAASFRGTKETVDPVLNELKFLQLQKLSANEKNVLETLVALADFQVKLVKLHEVKGASDHFVRNTLPVLSQLGADFESLETEAVQKRAVGDVLVGTKFAGTREWESALASTVEFLGVPVSKGSAGGEYINYEATKIAFEAAAEACLETAADLINNDGAVSVKKG